MSKQADNKKIFFKYWEKALYILLFNPSSTFEESKWKAFHGRAKTLAFFIINAGCRLADIKDINFLLCAREWDETVGHQRIVFFLSAQINISQINILVFLFKGFFPPEKKNRLKKFHTRQNHLTRNKEENYAWNPSDQSAFICCEGKNFSLSTNFKANTRLFGLSLSAILWDVWMLSNIIEIIIFLSMIVELIWRLFRSAIRLWWAPLLVHWAV